MEAVVPLFALGSLFVVNKKQREKKNAKEGFNDSKLPNAHVPDRNYPPEGRAVSAETDRSSQLSTVNRYDNAAGAYTDKYFTAQPSGSTDTYTSLSGEKVGGDYFQHNNMVPFFGSNLRSMMRDDTANEAVLDNYTGSGSQDISKQEQAPLFAPEDNYQWAHGAPNENDFYQSRVNASMRKANVLPFKQEQVGPGLGLGYGTEGGDGFNAGMMQRDNWQPKTVDDLRVASNPKAGGISAIGREGPAVARVKNIGSEGKFEKNRPDRHYENTEDRWFTTTGREKGVTSRAEQVERFTNRQETVRDYEGAAAYHTGGEYIPGQYRESHNVELGAVPLGHAHANRKTEVSDRDHGHGSARAYANNRSVGNDETYFGAIRHSVSAAIAPVMDVIRPSRKENTIGTLRPYQNAGARVSETYVYDPKNKAQTTHRETTEKSKGHMNVNRNQRGGGYEVARHQQAATSRAVTGDYYYAGTAGSARGKEMTSYESVVKNQRNNDIKSSTIKGRMVPGNMKMLNHEVNLDITTNRNDMLRNDRPQMASMPTQVPSASHMGASSTANNEVFSNIQMERTDANILDALKSNPYVVDFRKYN